MQLVRPIRSRIPWSLLILGLALGNNQAPAAYLDLNNYESIEIDYRSTGCFHQTHYRFVLSPGSEFPVVKIFKGSSSDPFAKKNDTGPNSHFLGTYELTAEQWIGLERMFEYYQQELPGGCTTQDSISVRFHHGDEMIENIYRDGSCRLHDVEAVTTFHDLIQAIPAVAIREQAKESEIAALSDELQKLKLPPDHNPVIDLFVSEDTSLQSALEQLHRHVPDLQIALSSSISETPINLKLTNLKLNRILQFISDRADCEWVFADQTIHFIDPAELDPEARNVDALILQKKRIEATIREVSRRPRF